MTLDVFHQLGYRHKWNMDCLIQGNIGDGLIIAPRHMKYDLVSNLSLSIKQKSIFDPQFYLPGTAKGKLDTYQFFPELITDGFKTEDYTGAVAKESALKCIEFQFNNDFEYITIPTRHVSGMPTNFINDQEELFIQPFLSVLQDNEYDKKILVQLIMNEGMIKDKEYSSDILNWITGFFDIDGVYLIVENSSTSKQIKDIDFLYELLLFIDQLNQNELEVILGYLNTEAIILSIAEPRIVTIGSYENTRMFKIESFKETKNKKFRNGPTPRLYVSKLLQWVDYRYIGAIERALGNNFFDVNKYRQKMFEPSYNWHFTKPELYKHQFLEFYKQLKSINNLEREERYLAVVKMIEQAKNSFEELDKKGVILDANSDGSHLAPWLTAINQFAIKKGWKRS